MFLSTVIPSTKLNVNKNLNTSPYNFSVPYNFVRGRNLVLTIMPMFTQSGSTGSYRMTGSVLPSTSGTWQGTNSLHIVIPDNVTEYTVTHEFMRHIHFSAAAYLGYTLQIEFNLTTQTITFTPVSYRSSSSNVTIDEECVAPVLLTIATIL